MKYPKNFITILIVLFTIINNQQLSAILTMSQYKPDSTLQKPYFTQDYYTNISCIFSGGFASQAYNQNSKKVPFLQQFGPESLLKKFTDSSLPHDNIENFGQGQLSGEFHVRELIISCHKNMTKGFFIEGATSIQNIFINSISLDFVSTPAHITTEQLTYLEKLQQKIPTSIDKSGMFTTAIYTGLSKSLQDFEHLDFIDWSIKVGMTSPQSMSESNSSIVQFPFNDNLNFGYPIIATASVGVLDWITIGYNGSIIPWQKAIATIPLNTNETNNTLLMPVSGRALVQRGPLFTTAIYLEADHVYQGYSGTIAYCYTQNSAYTITPIDSIQFSQTAIDQSQLFRSWSLGSLYLQLDVDFACETTPSAPVITIFCNIPLAGELCPKTNIFGGSCSLQLSYIF